DGPHFLPSFPTRRSSDLFGWSKCLLTAGFDQGVTCQRGVPHRRDARLAIGLVLADHQKPVEPPSCDGAWWIVRGFAQHLVHHHRSEEHTSELQSPYDLVC